MTKKVDAENEKTANANAEIIAPDSHIIALDADVAAFNTDLKLLLKKYDLELFAEPRILNGLLVADPKVGRAGELAKNQAEASAALKS